MIFQITELWGKRGKHGSQKKKSLFADFLDVLCVNKKTQLNRRGEKEEIVRTENSYRSRNHFTLLLLKHKVQNTGWML